MSDDCQKCGAKCCRYFCFEIDAPDGFDDLDDIRWFLTHEDVSVHVDDGDWYISIANRCKMLGPDNRCMNYEDRPLICRKYDPESCDATGGDYDYDELFEKPEDIEKYARRVMGGKQYDRKKQKARAKADRAAAGPKAEKKAAPSTKQKIRRAS